MKKTMLFTLLITAFFSVFAFGQAADPPASDQMEVQEAPRQSETVPAELDAATPVRKEAQVQPAKAQVPDETTAWADIWDWIKSHAAESIMALLAILKIIVNLTPTEKDNRWYDLVERFLNSLFPNLKKGGGTHTPA